MNTQLASAIREALDTLAQAGQGLRPDRAIAAYLRQEGIRGRRDDFLRCPVAQFLLRRVAVAPGELQVTGCWVFVPAQYVAVPLPEEVIAFIWAFDWGHFPALEEGEAV